MPVTCLVVGCGSRGDRDTVRFYAVPKILNNKFLTHKNDLSKKRRALWVAAIKRDDLTESKIKYQRVCSKHFITGKPASLEDENHPDWVPSQHMGHISQTVIKRPRDVERKERADKRKKMQPLQVEHAESLNSDNDGDKEHDELDTGVSSQTDVTMEDIDLQTTQLNFASQKLEALKQRVENSPFGLMDEIRNDDKWKYYTGYDYKIVNNVIFKQVEVYIPCTSTTTLSTFNQLILTLVKLRLDLHFKDLAYRFKISPTTASTYFQTLIEILYKRFKSLIIWPDRSILQNNVPSCFKEAFHDKTTVIVDCFEIFIENPAHLLTQQQCWSNYKHHCTIKFLIGITPQGTISFISEAWGGRASDKQIVEGSGFCNNIKPGDIVLADRGFLIKEAIGILQAKVVIPAFTKGKNQLHPLEIEETRQIAHVRVHVERIIGVIKNKFNILKGTIPISMLKKGNNENVNILDKIVTVCCAFINISPPIIPL